MLLKVIGTMAATSLLLAGCSLLPGAPAATGEPVPTAESTAPSSDSDCPDIEAGDFAVGIETTPADPVPMAESVGLGGVLEGTCAYGFESDQFDGIAFFIINPPEDEAAIYFGNAVMTGVQAGFPMNNNGVMNNSGTRDDGASFLVLYVAEVHADDAAIPAYSMEAMGLDDGASVILGSIQMPD
jgi:hypothetical protein